MVSDFFLKAVTDLQSKYNFSEFYVVAHSMGGLVTRSFVKKYQQEIRPAKLGFVMTINSPLGGMKSAQKGVENSPIVVPAWRDVASGSDFIAELNAWHWPKNIPYHLVFSFETGEGDDGVVALESQIPHRLQSEAERIYGYNAQHTGILKDDRFVTNLIGILNKGASKN